MCFEKSRASEATVEHAVELLVQFGESFTILRTLGCRYKIMRIDDPFVPPCTCTPVLVLVHGTPSGTHYCAPYMEYV